MDVSSQIIWIDFSNRMGDRRTIKYLTPVCRGTLSCLLVCHGARNDMPYPRASTATGPYWVKGVCFSTHIRRRPAKENQSPQLRLLFLSSICVFGCHQFGIREGMDTIPHLLVAI